MKMIQVNWILNPILKIFCIFVKAFESTIYKQLSSKHFNNREINSYVHQNFKKWSTQ